MRERTVWASDVHGVSRARTGASGRDASARVGADATAAQRPAGEGGDWVWRHRRELRAPVVVAVLAGVSTWGHLLVPGLAWAPVLVGLAAACAAVIVPLPVRERRYALIWVGPATAWTAMSWLAGIDQLGVLGAFLLLGGGVVAHWVRLQNPRSRIEVIGGSIWPWRWEAWRWRRQARRELGHVAEIWPWIAERIGVPGAKLRRLVGDIDDGYAVHVDLARGQTSADIRADRLHSALRMPVAALTLDPQRPWEVVLEEILAAAEDEPAGAAEASEEPRPKPVDQLAERLERLRAALRAADVPLSIRKLAKASGLEPTWIWRTGLPELQRAGQVAQGERGWTWAG